jgi:cytochrome c oxidase cbb3-type subunit III
MSCRAGWLAMASALAVLTLGGCGRQGPAAAPAALPTAAVTPPPAIRYESHLAAGGLLPPGGVLKNPHAGDAGVAKAGAALFIAMNCDGCHGPDASGNWAPNLAGGRWRYGGADDEVFMSIYYGRPKGMPAFGGAIGADGVWTLITYLRSLTPPANVPTESWEN